MQDAMLGGVVHLCSQNSGALKNLCSFIEESEVESPRSQAMCGSACREIEGCRLIEERTQSIQISCSHTGGADPITDRWRFRKLCNGGLFHDFFVVQIIDSFLVFAIPLASAV